MISELKEQARSIRWKQLLKYAFVFFLFLIMIIAWCNYHIINSTNSQIFSDVSLIPKNDVALLLGASKKARGGNDNLYFKYRIEAAAQLFKSGKVKHIIVSGDNHKKEYDEATDMCDALIALGVPDSCITLDYAGFRTHDSMVRCLKVFGQKNVTVISQQFHNQRAVFIGNKYGMNVVAFNAKDVPNQYSMKTRLREYFAKFKAVLDLYILDTQPKFLGEEVKIEL
ncbi:MAG: YdcF family protein [Bacteroidota bacterium]|nr:YdcF family protein [Bacteroidota bacterium]